MSTLTGDIRANTYKAGLLSKVAHDLQLTLERFEITVDGDRIEARFWPESLRVDGAVEGGRLVPGALKPKDIKDIHKNITNKILHTRRSPVARFEGTRAGDQITGQLTLAGQSASLSFSVNEQAGRWTGRFTLVPTRWGIAPFKALMGAIKLQDKIDISFDLG
jgi:hypothetical protein